MTRKGILAAALLLPCVALSGAAYAGPTSTYPPAQSAQPSNGPYAMSMPAAHADGSICRYQGGPKSPIWHQQTRQ